MFTTPFTFLKAASGGIDPDAQAFFDAITAAGGSLTSTEEDAVNNLVLDLKADSLWTGLEAIYPLVGSTATTQKFNLKDPRDLNAAYRLTFNGGWTHTSTGAKSNGTNAYANTYYNANTVVQNDTSIGFYARLDIAISGNPIDMGAFDETTGFGLLLAAEIVTNLPRLRMYQNAADSTGTNQQGFWTGAAGANTRLIKNGSVLTTIANSGTFPLSNGNILFGALNGGFGNNPGYYAEQEYAFVFIGRNLTNTQASDLYTTVQTYQTALSRQV